MSNFEKRFEPKIESIDVKDKNDPTDPDREKLKEFLNTVAAELKKEGVPYKDKGEMRIDMSSRENISKREIERDKEEVKELRNKFHEKLVEKYGKDRAKAREIAGDNLEMLKTAIFYKFLRKNFIIARSTDYDDTKRHVDNIILDKKTNNMVCAIDETTDLEDVEGKKGKAWEINGKDGASLKYGLMYEEEIFKSPGKRELKNILKVKENRNIPLFYLALPFEVVKKGLKEFKSDVGESSESEEQIYKYFIDTIREQIGHFPNNISNQETRTNLNNFYKTSFTKFEQVLRGVYREG